MNSACAKLPRFRAAFISLALAVACETEGGFVNLSTRAVAYDGADAIIAGFVIQGESSIRTLIRAAGPTLATMGVPGTLEEVRLELWQDGLAIASNTGWDEEENAAEVAEAARLVGAFDFVPGSKDAALIVTLTQGAYTAHVTPAHSGTTSGIALVEVYDTEPESGARLVNLSTRARVGSGDDILIGGFVINGSNNRILIRGVGPGLTPFGVEGALNVPSFRLFQGETLRAGAGSWGMSADMFEIASRTISVGGFPLVPNSADAALLVRPDAGNHTAQMLGADSGTGIALLELYDVHALTGLPPVEVFDLVGFARLAAAGRDELSGGGEPGDDYDPITRTGNYWRIDDETPETPDFGQHFRTALTSDQPLIVEINTIIDLSTVGNPDTNPNRSAIAHPDLFADGEQSGFVGVITVGSNKTIYSALGNGVIKRGQLAIAGTRNIMIRNLRFRELWEWDDATAGAYDRNDWDYIVLVSDTDGDTVTARTRNIWIDHCDFANAYDGQIDVVRGSDLVTVSWCRFGAGYSDDAAAWVERQMAYLEANFSEFPYYAWLRRSLSAEEVLARARPHRKSNLVGNGASAVNAAQDTGYLNITFHHNWYHGVDQRMPRMRFGNGHVFNLWADDTPLSGVSGLARGGVFGTSRAAIKVESSTFINVATPVSNRTFGEFNGVITVTGNVNLN